MEQNEQEKQFPLAAAVSLVILGIVFLLRNFGVLEINNWWALFFFVPVAYLLISAWTTFRAKEGRLTHETTSPIIGSLVLITVALVFLLELDWGSIWPVYMIIGAVAILLNSLAKEE
ncbi:MAG: hypothetical protein GX552_01420 [Chloroflexi bacterium]|jgi:phosphatidylserine synthase|nr:hypothetical protein [Chloroflexota bacterium]